MDLVNHVRFSGANVVRTEQHDGVRWEASPQPEADGVRRGGQRRRHPRRRDPRRRDFWPLNWRIELRAVGAVRAGDELRMAYYDTEAARNDLTFLQNGFLNDTDTRLCSFDLPFGWNASAPLDPVADEDVPVEDYDAAAANTELLRLQRIISGLAPLQADEAALARHRNRWTADALLLRLRIVRKRALRARLLAVQDHLRQLSARVRAGVT
jgi:hypothetical protein